MEQLFYLYSSDIYYMYHKRTSVECIPAWTVESAALYSACYSTQFKNELKAMYI